MRPKDRLRPGELLELLGINLQRLRVWLEKGLLGEEYRRTGRGYPRSFSRQDAIILRTIVEIMNLTHRSQPITEKGLVKEVALGLREVLGTEGAMISSSTGKPVSAGWWLILSWDREKNDWHLTSVQGGGTDFPRRNIYDANAKMHFSTERHRGQAVILIPLWELIEEVDHYFETKGVR